MISCIKNVWRQIVGKWFHESILPFLKYSPWYSPSEVSNCLATISTPIKRHISRTTECFVSTICWSEEVASHFEKPNSFTYWYRGYSFVEKSKIMQLIELSLLYFTSGLSWVKKTLSASHTWNKYDPLTEINKHSFISCFSMY